MSLPENYNEILTDMINHGCEISHIEYDKGRVWRFKHALSKDPKAGWSELKSFPLPDGSVCLIGGYGVWIGSDNNAVSVKLNKDISSKLSKEDHALIRQSIRDNAKRAEAERKAMHDRAAKEALKQWNALSQEGESGYKERKKIRAANARYDSDGVMYYALRDTAGRMHGLQAVYDKANPKHKEQIKRMDGDKRFLPTGLAVKAHFDNHGKINSRGINLLTEGQATGDTLHEATGLPVVVAFNANNVLPVLQALVKYYPKAKFIIAADDDYLCRCRHCKKQTLVADKDCAHCSKEHGKFNTGVSVAMKAAMRFDAAEWIKPVFLDREGKKLTDFNDLAVIEGLQVVADQLQQAVADKFPSHGLKAEPSAPGAITRGAGCAPKFMTIDQALERYSSIYGVKETMFDNYLYRLVPRSCVMDITPDHAWKQMKDQVRIFDIEEVGFDASEKDARIKCNMFAGWPSKPSNKGSCVKLLEMLEYLCSSDKNPRQVYQWVLKWLAYPIQHPGAKMKTALVFHGPTRVGKNLFFDAFSEGIYEDYAGCIGQSELEDKFNECFSRKLFVVANEIVARQDLFHQKNKIKALVTDPYLTINPKNVAAHKEKNQMNIVFLSNEGQPVVPDPDDARFMVIWTPPRRDKCFYADVIDEITHDGIAALHDYLLNLDLGDFDVGTHPPMTDAKSKLVNLSKDSVQRFAEDWRDGYLPYPFIDCMKSDLFIAYVRWCKDEGERFPRSQNQFSTDMSRFDDIQQEVKPIYAGLGSALIASPHRDSLRAKVVRMYRVNNGDDGLQGEVMRQRTQNIVKFKEALDGGTNV